MVKPTAPADVAILSPTQAIAWLVAQGIQTRAQWLAHQDRSTPTPGISLNLYAAHGQAFWDAGGWAAIHNDPAHHASPERVAALGRRHKVTTPAQWAAVLNALPEKSRLGMPEDPSAVFPNLFTRLGWDGFFSWPRGQSFANLDDDTVSRILPLQEASRLAATTGLRSRSEWRQAARAGRTPVGVPDDPERHYGQAFQDQGGWLAFLGARAALIAEQWHEDASGDDAAAPRYGDLLDSAFPTSAGHGLKRSFVDLTAFSAFARQHGVVSQSDWHKRCGVPGFRPEAVPRNPEQVYGSAFAALGGWAGVLRDERPHTAWTASFRPLDDTTEWLQANQVRSAGDFFRRCREPGFRPKDIPSNPALAYGAAFAAAGGWSGVLHNGGPAPSRRQSYPTLAEAARLIQAAGVKSASQYAAASKAGRLPAGLPSAPDKVYADQGWRDAGGWVGFLLSTDQPHPKPSVLQNRFTPPLITTRPGSGKRNPGADAMDQSLSLGPAAPRIAKRQKSRLPTASGRPTKTL